MKRLFIFSLLLPSNGPWYNPFFLKEEGLFFRRIVFLSHCVSAFFYASHSENCVLEAQNICLSSVSLIYEKKGGCKAGRMCSGSCWNIWPTIWAYFNACANHTQGDERVPFFCSRIGLFHWDCVLRDLTVSILFSILKVPCSEFMCLIWTPDYSKNGTKLLQMGSKW